MKECGFYPELVSESIAGALGTQDIVAHLVHHEATFTGHEVQRHMTVLVLTNRQLIIVHTDDSDQGNPERALTTSEVVALRAIDSVVVTRSIAQPELSTGELAEAWLTVVCGAASRLDLGPAGCDDPDCVADHGFTGTLAPADLALRISALADGPRAVSDALHFHGLLVDAIDALDDARS